MPIAALLLALVAAVLHALWNLLIAREKDAEAALAMAFLVGVAVSAPIAALTWRVDGAAVPFVVVSAALELVYMVLLARAYAGGDVTTVYPVARGSAPVLVLFGGALFGGAPLGGLRIAGAVLVACGVAVLRGLRPGGGRDLAFGFAVGAAIASYTLVDDHGLEHAATLPYLTIVIGVPAVLYAGGLTIVRGPARLWAAMSPTCALAGIGTFAAYGAFLLALERTSDPAPVAAIRESSVLIAALLSAWLLRQPVRARAIAAALTMTTGIAVLALA